MTSDLQRQRHIDLDGTTNFRNLGGYHTNDGAKMTKWGVVYRCDHLCNVPVDKAQSVLVDILHIHASYDLRSHSEVVARNYNFPHINRHCVSIEPTRILEFIRRGEPMSNPKVVFRAMEEVYRQMVTDYGPVVGSIVKEILSSNPSADNASVIHCTAGKDRTGWVCYALLTLLGITEEEKRADYMLTNTYFHPPNSAPSYIGTLNDGDDVKQTLSSVFAEFLDAGIDELNKLGGMDAYAKSHMGLTDEDIQKLREVLLE